MKKLFILCLCGFCYVSMAQSESPRPSFQEQFIQLPNGITLQYVEQGNTSGVPVIFLHGVTDSWHSFETTLAYMPKTLHAFALTQRGHGNSSKPEGTYRPKDFAADVAAFIKAKQLGQVVIVGHSMGGLVALQFALDYPALTKALVIVDSDAAFKDNPGFPEFTSEVMKLTDPVPYEFAESFQMSTLSQPMEEAYYQRLVAESLKVPARVWREAMQEILNADLTALLPQIKKPTLIFWGDKDSFCLRDDQEELLKGIAGSTIKIYEGTGHALHWQEPERFTKDLTGFIANL
jgi:non-heme chloroperoxidase